MDTGMRVSRRNFLPWLLVVPAAASSGLVHLGVRWEERDAPGKALHKDVIAIKLTDKQIARLKLTEAQKQKLQKFLKKLDAELKEAASSDSKNDFINGCLVGAGAGSLVGALVPYLTVGGESLVPSKASRRGFFKDVILKKLPISLGLTSLALPWLNQNKEAPTKIELSDKVDDVIGRVIDEVDLDKRILDDPASKDLAALCWTALPISLGIHIGINLSKFIEFLSKARSDPHKQEINRPRPTDPPFPEVEPERLSRVDDTELRDAQRVLAATGFTGLTSWSMQSHKIIPEYIPEKLKKEGRFFEARIRYKTGALEQMADFVIEFKYERGQFRFSRLKNMNADVPVEFDDWKDINSELLRPEYIVSIKVVE